MYMNINYWTNAVKLPSGEYIPCYLIEEIGIRKGAAYELIVYIGHRKTTPGGYTFKDISDIRSFDNANAAEHYRDHVALNIYRDALEFVGGTGINSVRRKEIADMDH